MRALSNDPDSPLEQSSCEGLELDPEAVEAKLAEYEERLHALEADMFTTNRAAFLLDARTEGLRDRLNSLGTKESSARPIYIREGYNRGRLRGQEDIKGYATRVFLVICFGTLWGSVLASLGT